MGRLGWVPLNSAHWYAVPTVGHHEFATNSVTTILYRTRAQHQGMICLTYNIGKII